MGNEEKLQRDVEQQEQGAASAKAQGDSIGGMSRRAFTLGSVGAVAALALGGLKFVPEKSLVRPPGGQDENLLFSACIRCEKCYEICPHHAIRLAHIEDGIIGMRMPEMDFTFDYCNFCVDENNGSPLCVQVCPTQALRLDEDATPEKTIIGIAELNMDWCLAYHLIGCRFCYDACPYEAMKLDEINRPYVLQDLCTGCGACESVCVSMKEGSISAGADSRAIVVKSLKEYEASTVNRAAM